MKRRYEKRLLQPQLFKPGIDIHEIKHIGAGSLSFFSRLASDILTHETSCDAELALVEIDEQRLEYAGRIADRIFKEGGYRRRHLHHGQLRVADCL